MTVEAASVDCAYVDGAYVELPVNVDMSDVWESVTLCFTKVKLAFRLILETDGVYLDLLSKRPDRFSRKDIGSANPESLLD